MNNLKSMWDILNGKKVTIGALMMLAAQVLKMVGQGEWAGIVEQLIEILNIGGASIVGLGAVHKVQKQMVA